jgi:hypothetical protein
VAMDADGEPPAFHCMRPLLKVHFGRMSSFTPPGAVYSRVLNERSLGLHGEQMMARK